jgi:hypothetical protein
MSAPRTFRDSDGRATGTGGRLSGGGREALGRSFVETRFREAGAMTFRRGMRVVCVWSAEEIAAAAATCVLAYGEVPTLPVPGAVYRVADLEEIDELLFLTLVELGMYVYDSRGFRPAVEGEAELGRLRWLCEGAPAIAPARRRELETVGCGVRAAARLVARPSRASVRDPSSGAMARRRRASFDALLAQGEKRR